MRFARPELPPGPVLLTSDGRRDLERAHLKIIWEIYGVRDLTSEVVNMDDKVYEIKYYKYTNFNGVTIYSSEVDFGKNDKVILDDNSIYSLENKLRVVVPAAILTRKMTIETTETIKTILLMADKEKKIGVLSGPTT